MAQMIEAVAELEKCHIAHRDIKPSNFLVKSRGPPRNANYLNGECQESPENVFGQAFVVFQLFLWTAFYLNRGVSKFPNSFEVVVITKLVSFLKKAYVDPTVETAKSANMRMQVALTDFGCAIRTDNGGSTDGDHAASHSGNTALWAPEVASHFSMSREEPVPLLIYKRADIWAVATIAYQLFGQPNPFISGVRPVPLVYLLV